MKIDDIKRIARSILMERRIENSYIEYKKSVNFRSQIIKTICAFANNYMNNEIGLIFIGVEEVQDRKTGEKAVPKIPISGIQESMIEDTENQLKSMVSHVHPRVNYHIVSDSFGGNYFVVLAIEPSVDGPFETSYKAEKDKGIKLRRGRYVRTSRDSAIASPHEEFELLRKFSGFDFCAQINETATIDDLNFEYMREYLVRTNAKSDIRELSKIEMAQSMGLISESEFGKYRAKNFAVLMFCDRPRDFIKGAHLKIIQEVKGTDRMQANVYDGPIWIQAKKAIDYFNTTIHRAYTDRFRDIPEHLIIDNYPEITFEELLINAVVHKDYSVPNYVGVYVYKDRISFVNHNRPLPPITIDDLNNLSAFDKRQYLNKELKEMFFSLDLIESYGSGIRRAKDALERNGSPNLEYISGGPQDNSTNVVIKIHPEFLEDPDVTAGQESRYQEVSSKKTSDAVVQTKAKSKTKKIQSRQQEIIEIIKSNPNVTKREIGDILGITASGVSYHVRNMTADGIVEYIGTPRSGYWVIL